MKKRGFGKGFGKGGERRGVTSRCVTSNGFLKFAANLGKPGNALFKKRIFKPLSY